MDARNKPQIDHTEYQKRVRSLTYAGLYYTIRDCKSALEAMPDGEKAGVYADEISYCSAELKRRNKR